MRRPSFFWWSIGSIAVHAAMAGGLLFFAWSPRFESSPLEISVIEVGAGVHPKKMNALNLPSPPLKIRGGRGSYGSEDHNPSQPPLNLRGGDEEKNNPYSGVPYEVVLASWLERQKQYPPLAKKSGVEGRVAVRIVIDQIGTVEKASIVEGSGSALLDREALAMVKRADPFPPLPRSSYTAPFEFIAPIRFLREGDVPRK